jgi:hypothetical protein
MNLKYIYKKKEKKKEKKKKIKPEPKGPISHPKVRNAESVSFGICFSTHAIKTLNPSRNPFFFFF